MDLFSLPPTQVSIEKSQWVEHRPLASIGENSNIIEFLVNGTGEEYVDLSETYLHLNIQVFNKDSTPLVAGADVAPINLIAHSAFCQIECSLNERLITQSSNLYPYRAYFEHLLSYGNDAKRSQLTAAGWYVDTAGKMEYTTDNRGHVRRTELAEESKIVSLIAKPCLDLCNQRLIPNRVDIKLRLAHSSDSFCLMGDGKLVIKDAALYVRKVKLSPSVQLGHIKALERGTAKFPVKRVEVKTFTVPAGNLTVNHENLFLGQLPNRLLFGLVENQSFVGQSSKNPYNFRHFDTDYVALFLDGAQIPSKPLQPDFENRSYVRSYCPLFSGMNIMGRNQGNGISLSEYPKGFSLFAFDLSPDLWEGDHFQLIRSGNLRLELHFKNPLPATIDVLVYAEFSNVIECDKARNILFDYIA